MIECIRCGTEAQHNSNLCRFCLKDESRTCSAYWENRVANKESILADALDYAERLHGKPEAEIVEKF